MVAAGKQDQVDAALKLGADLEAAGISVLVDDRTNASGGVKFKDAELLGMPKIVVVGRGLVDGNRPPTDDRGPPGHAGEGGVVDPDPRNVDPGPTDRGHPAWRGQIVRPRRSPRPD